LEDKAHHSMTCLIAIEIGPVQDFTAAARPRDLWFGCHLLSEVSKAAARALWQAGASLLFPCSDDAPADLAEGSDFTAVNKLLVLSDRPPTQVCREAKAAALAQLQRARDEALQEAARRQLVVDIPMVASQIGSLLEFSAVWVPYEPARHQDARTEVKLLLAARKTLCDFPQYELGSALPKSSLDGFRETVLLKNDRPPKLFESNLQRNEHLDAIGLIKRFGPPLGKRAMGFDATIDIAAQPYVNRIQESREFEQYRSFLATRVRDETSAYLYGHDSRQLFDQEEKDLSPEDQTSMEQLAAIRHKIYEKHGRPNAPYYALMIGDGDSLGNAIRSLHGAAEHQAFSKELSRFAARSIQAATRSWLFCRCIRF
jgi:CRISPR-associated protein Cmr2